MVFGTRALICCVLGPSGVEFGGLLKFVTNVLGLSIYLSTYLPTYLSIYLTLSYYLCICLPIHLSIYLYLSAIYLSIHLSIHFYIYVSMYVSIYLSIYLSVCPSIYLYVLVVWNFLKLPTGSSFQISRPARTPPVPQEALRPPAGELFAQASSSSSALLPGTWPLRGFLPSLKGPSTQIEGIYPKLFYSIVGHFGPLGQVAWGCLKLSAVAGALLVT